MDCNCEKAPEFPTKAFIPGPIEIPINFRAVTIPADQGDDVANPPQNGAYRNVVLKYAANGHTYIYSSDGIPVMLVGSITFNSLPDRPKYDGQPMTSYTDIPDLTDEVSTLQSEVQALATDFSYKGSVEDYAHLPNDAEVGDVYTTLDTGVIYVWDGDEWVALNEYPPVFTGTDGSADGTVGLVPAPETTDAGKVLGASGNWEQNGPTIVQTTGASTTDVMSQKATTDMLWKDPTNKLSILYGTPETSGALGTNTANVMIGSGMYIREDGGYNVAIGYATSIRGQSGRSVAIGAGAKVWGDDAVAIGYTSSGPASALPRRDVWSVAIGSEIGAVESGTVAIGHQASANRSFAVAIGKNASIGATGAVALGSYSSAVAQGEVNVGTAQTSYGYNNTNYRLISGVYTPGDDYDAANKAYVDANTPTNFTTNEWNALWA